MGLEELTVAELWDLGLAPGETGRGGVAFSTDLRGLARANLHLRTASRILVRLLEFTARDFPALEKQARRIPWDRFTRAGDTVRFRVTCKKSRLYHQRAVAQRFGDAAREAGRDVVGGAGRTRPSVADAASGAEVHAGVDQDPVGLPPESPTTGPGEAPQTLVVRLFRDRCTVSVDASGEHLHRRGYRLATAKAPMRENLAAAALLAVDWDPAFPLVDPMCGSGTLLIEAAMLARRIPPGLRRSFAFQSWPGIDTEVVARCVEQGVAGVRDRAPAAIVGADRDAGALAACRENAARAGVEADLELFHRPLSASEPPAAADRGWLVTNPPYGHRVGTQQRLRDLYAALGNVARRRFPGWSLAVVCPDPVLVGQIGVALEPALTVRHGGLPVRVWTGPVPDA